MSDADDPFGVSKRKGKTIVRPNPGGRWSEGRSEGQQAPMPPNAMPSGPMPPGSMPPGPLPPTAGGMQGGGDPWRGGFRDGPDPYAPTPAGYEYGQRAAPDLHRPPPSPISGPAAGPADPMRHAGAAPALGEAPDLAEIRTPNRNPIVRAATPLLLLLGRLRLTMTAAQFDALMRDVYTAIRRFQNEVRNAGVPDAQSIAAAYVLCATSDDIVQNLPSAERHQWTQYSMLTQFFGQTVGGVEFFQHLDRAKQDPASNFGVLEVMHACLSLGFYGKYRAVQGGQQSLERERQNLYELLCRVRPRPGDDISPHWQGLDARQRKAGFSIPMWSVAATAGAILLGMYVTMMLLLSSSSEVVASRAGALYPTAAVELAREGYQPRPPAPLPPPENTAMDKIAGSLSGVDGLEIVQSGPGIMLRLRAQFDTAAATLRPEFRTLVESVSKTLDQVDGDLLVVGHTDSDPIRSNPRFPSNWHLSVERAKSVAEVMKGILQAPGRVQVEGRGSDDPIAPNTTREGKAVNRRVEVFLKTANPVVSQGN